MKFIDLQAQMARVQSGVDKRLKRIFDSAAFINGPDVKEFELLSAQYLGYEYGVGVASGTDALSVSLMALGVCSGTRVFLPAYTYSATAEVICLLGATPVFVDVDPESFLLDPYQLDIALQEFSRPNDAVITVDLFGAPCDYDQIKNVVERYDTRLIIDGAQSFGNSYKARKSIDYADVFCTSFFPAKPLGCAGDGGAIYTNNSELAQICRSIKNHGMGDDKYDIKRVGVNGRLDTLQAAVLIEKLSIFDMELSSKSAVLGRYKRELPVQFSPQALSYEISSGHAQAVFKLSAEMRGSEVQERLKVLGVPTMIYYPKTVADQTAYSNNAIEVGELPVSRGLCNQTIALPFHAYLTDSEIDVIIDAVATVCDDLSEA